MKLCIFGAGGFAKEVYWLANQFGHEVGAFIDIHPGESYRDIPIKDESFFKIDKHLAIVAVGDCKTREKITRKIIDQYGVNSLITLISNRANILDKNISIGRGSVICDNCILTCDIKLGLCAQLNLATTIGHDTVVGDFFTTAPGVHISGKVNAGDRVYLGTNASIIEDIKICDDVVIGAAACVAKNITESGTYVGVPAKKLERKNG